MIPREKSFSEEQWESKEFEWTGKSFYYVPILNILGHPIGLSSKLELLNREVRQNAYLTKNYIMLIQYSMFGGCAMIEVEKQDKYDAQVKTYDETTTVATIVHKGSLAGIGKTVKRLKERVVSRRGMLPREIYYWLTTGPGSERMVLFAVS